MARRPCQYARVVQLDERLITNQEVWEFESPRALHNSQGVGKLGNPPALEAGDRGIEARLPDQLCDAARSVERRAVNATVPSLKLLRQCDDVAECRGSRLQPAPCRLDSCRRLHAPVARMDKAAAF